MADSRINAIATTVTTVAGDDYIAVDGTTNGTQKKLANSLVTLTDTQTLTNKTLTSPTLTAPVLGTPASGALTNCTAIPSAQIVGVIPIANLATGTPDGTKFVKDDGTLAVPAGGGDVSGPVSSTDTAIARWSSTGGDTLLDSGILIDASDNITGVNDMTVDGTLDVSGATITGGTGTGTIVREDTPTLITPLLGTPTSGTLTNCTGLPASALVAGTLAASTAFTFGENTELKLDAALSADGKYCGITEAGTAGATLAFGDVVYLAAADSRWELTDANASATAGPVKVGICVLAAASDGDPTTLLLWGKIRADTAFPTFTISAPVFLSGTAGDVTNTAPSASGDIVRIVGYGNTADELHFCPDATYLTVT